MSSDDRLIAARYVQALFDLAAEGGKHDEVKADLLMLKSILEVSVELQRLLTNPILTREEAKKAVYTTLSAIKASDLTCKFFALLARNRRLAITALAIDAYLARLAESRGELTVQVTSAEALSHEETEGLSDAIGKSTGKKAQIKAQVNPSLLGGLQLRIGSRLFDTSVASKLARLKQTLTKAA